MKTCLLRFTTGFCWLMMAISTATQAGTNAKTEVLLSGAASAWSLPLSTKGRDIVDAKGQVVQLKAVNWFGAESGEFVVGGLDKQPLAYLVGLIQQAGFNAVRLPWSNELVEANPNVEAEYLSANPDLQGKTALAIFDQLVQALTQAGVAVILDNHRSRGDWCCDADHGDGLWHTPAYPEKAWLADWDVMAKRYLDNPLVLGYELRNEIRYDKTLNLRPSWGDGNPHTDWRLAAIKAGNTLLAINPHALIIVGGIDYQSHLRGMPEFPVTLNVRNKLVYAVHNYAWWHKADALADDTLFDERQREPWGFMLEAETPHQAPIFVSEWGGCTQLNQQGQACSQDRLDFPFVFARHINRHHLSYAWWPLNGTQSSGYNRHRGEVEPYGLLDPSWSYYVAPELMQVLGLSSVPRP